MTRESKLALILSFVLILVVGVLVSDHFSQANDMDPDRLEAEGRQPLVQLPGAEKNRINNAIDQVLAPKQEPVEIANGSNRNDSIRSGSLLGELSGGLTKTIDDFRAPALASPTKTEPVEQATRPLGEIAHKAYTVQEGDSLYKIAADVLGNGNRWTEIQRLNADKVGTSGIINPGMTLKLPTSARVSTHQAVPMRETTQAAAKTYTVASGDTLGEISMKLLGTSKRVDEFVKINNLDDANDIRVGMTLKVPSK